jgi:hypothetical protein
MQNRRPETPMSRTFFVAVFRYTSKRLLREYCM